MGGRRVFKDFGAFGLIIFIWLLYIGIVRNQESRGDVAATVPSPRILKYVRLARRKVHSFPWNPDFIYVSKRRVPSGPDPIHNRYIGETRQPPDPV